MRQTTVFLIAAAIIAFGLVAGIVAGAMTAPDKSEAPVIYPECTIAV
ncbi:putative membrane protein [Rhodococcus phage E3]|nr:hypothetical protein M176_gp181 [Rhodococcus phage E3]AEQ21089.1 putative membrane protein [Rhodococcus phage E3]